METSTHQPAMLTKVRKRGTSNWYERESSLSSILGFQDKSSRDAMRDESFSSGDEKTEHHLLYTSTPAKSRFLDKHGIESAF